MCLGYVSRGRYARTGATVPAPNWRALAEGTPIPVGSIPIMEYRRGTLAVRYWPQQGRLDVWYGGGKVLTIERWGGKLQLKRYVPGPWEGVLAQAAKVAA
jgi:hypothetical protein